MGLLDALQDPLFWRDVRRNARDLGQSASNAALSNITGPVDGINTLLKLLNMNSAEPVGGAKWADQMGLSAEVQQGAPKVAGETIGLTIPFAAAKPKDAANALLQLLEGRK